MRSIVPTMRWGRYGSSRDEAAACEFPVIYFADILTEGSVIEKPCHGRIHSKILVVSCYILSDLLKIVRTLNKGEAVDIFCKPRKLLCVLGFGVFGNRPQLLQVHICAVDGGCKAIQFVNPFLGGDLLEAFRPFFTFDANVLS